MAWSWRTIFLLIRGVDQTGRAFEGPTRALTRLQKQQRELARSSYRLMFAGAAFLAFGAMGLKALSGLFTMTSKGKLLTDDLSLAWSRFAFTIAESTTKFFEPALKSLTWLFDKLAQNPLLAGMIGIGGVLLTTGAVGLGLGLGLKGIAGMLAGALGGGAGLTLTQQLQMSLSHTGGVVAGAAAGTGLRTTIATALGGMFATIKGAAVTYGTAGLSVAIPVLLTLLLAYTIGKTAWWMSQPKEKQIEMAIAAGERQAEMRERFGLPEYPTDPSYYSPGTYMPLGGDVYVDIHGNVWERDVDEEALGRELGYHIVEDATNQGILKP